MSVEWLEGVDLAKRLLLLEKGTAGVGVSELMQYLKILGWGGCEGVNCGHSGCDEEWRQAAVMT